MKANMKAINDAFCKKEDLYFARDIFTIQVIVILLLNCLSWQLYVTAMWMSYNSQIVHGNVLMFVISTVYRQ